MFKFDELQEAAAPLYRYLQKEGNPHMVAVVTFDQITVYSADIGCAPIEEGGQPKD